MNLFSHEQALEPIIDNGRKFTTNKTLKNVLPKMFESRNFSIHFNISYSRINACNLVEINTFVNLI